MKLEFEYPKILKALQRVCAVAEKKTTMPILGNVLVEAQKDRILFTSTDLEIGIQSSCEAVVQMEGKICTPAHNFLDIVKQLPEVKANLQKGENDWLILKSGKAQFRIASVSAQDFPEIPSAKLFDFTKIRVETLRTAIEKTYFAISSDEMRYNLNGVLVEKIETKGKTTGFRMVATDGHRLSMFSGDFGEEESLKMENGVILPKKGMGELRKILGDTQEKFIEVSITKTNAAFRLGETVLHMKLVVGEFPDYSRVIPKSNKKKLVINRELFTNSLRRVSLLSEGKSKCIRLSIHKDALRLVATSPELGEAEEELQAEFDGGELNVGFNARYILDALLAVSGEQVVLELDQEQSPGVVRGNTDPGYFGVIMPMRI